MCREVSSTTNKEATEAAPTKNDLAVSGAMGKMVVLLLIV